MLATRTNDDDDTKVMKDGEVLKVPLHLCDELQREIAAESQARKEGIVRRDAVAAGVYETPEELERRRNMTPEERAAKKAADKAAHIASSGRPAPVMAARLHRPGDLPITDADRQKRQNLQRDRDTALSERWRNPPGTHEPVTDTSQVAVPPQRLISGDARANAYASYDERITNAWRRT